MDNHSTVCLGLASTVTKMRAAVYIRWMREKPYTLLTQVQRKLKFSKWMSRVFVVLALSATL